MYHVLQICRVWRQVADYLKDNLTTYSWVRTKILRKGFSHGISCLLILGSTKMLQATQTSFQSAPRSSHTRCMTSCLPSRIPTISLSLSHQLSKSSNRAFSGTLSISIRNAFTFSLQRRIACAKSLSAVKFIRRGWVSTKGMRVPVSLWSLSDGCRSSTPKKNREALERPRRIALRVFSAKKSN